MPEIHALQDMNETVSDCQWNFADWHRKAGIFPRLQL